MSQKVVCLKPFELSKQVSETSFDPFALTPDSTPSSLSTPKDDCLLCFSIKAAITVHLM